MKSKLLGGLLVVVGLTMSASKAAELSDGRD
jgi:hypothetical protein